MNTEEFTVHLETTYNELTEQALVILKRMVTDKMDNDPEYKALDIYSFHMGRGGYLFINYDVDVIREFEIVQGACEVSNFIDNVCKDLKLANHSLTFYRSSHHE